MKILDFDNVVLGRASSVVAKTLLLGEDVLVVNCEKAIVKGTPDSVIEKFKRRWDWRHKGNPVSHGPKYSRTPDRIVRFTIKHMLPDTKSRGEKALSRLRVYIGIPTSLKSATVEKMPQVQNTEPKRFLSIAQVSRKLGAESMLKREAISKRKGLQ